MINNSPFSTLNTQLSVLLKPQVEICAYSIESAIIAQNAGADRVELCSGFAEGGLTPSFGAMKLARKYLKIDCYAMIRPRGGDFYYSETELNQMRYDIETAKRLGMDGVVFGILQPNGNINITLTRELVQLAAPMNVTFHRAFDLSADPFRSLEDVIVCGCRNILTSGHAKTAEEGLETIRELTKRAGERINIMAGCGITPINASLFVEAGAHALHLSATQMKNSGMIFRNGNIPIMQADRMTDYVKPGVNEQMVRTLVDMINSGQ